MHSALSLRRESRVGADQAAAVNPSGSLTAWRPIRTVVLDLLSKHLSFDLATVWLLQPDRPMPDELLAQTGVTARAIRQWCSSGHLRSSLLHDSLVAGRAVGRLGDANLVVSTRSSREHAIAHALPESHPQRRWWLALLSRTGIAFSEGDRQALDIVLRQLQTGFNQPDGPGAARALVGHDDLPISTDMAFLQMSIRLGKPVRELLRRLGKVRDQRWETFKDDATHDLVMEVGEEAFWVIFRQTRAIDLPEATQWMVELRPVAKLAPPPVGLVSDQRIARAIGYIHDHFQNNPSLDQMAAQAHVSPFHFHRVFTRLTGVSPKRYLQLKQLQIASQLLCATHTPMRDIARLAGFTSHSHFNAAFRRLVGCSPTEHRATAENTHGAP